MKEKILVVPFLKHIAQTHNIMLLSSMKEALASPALLSCDYDEVRVYTEQARGARTLFTWETPQAKAKADGKPVHASQSWKPEDDKQLKTLKNKGLKYSAIAKMMGRTTHACSCRVSVLRQKDYWAAIT